MTLSTDDADHDTFASLVLCGRVENIDNVILADDLPTYVDFYGDILSKHDPNMMRYY